MIFGSASRQRDSVSHLFNNIANLGRKIDYGLNSPVGNAIRKVDPAMSAVLRKSDIGAQNFVLGSPNPGTRFYGEASPGPPGPATQDTAANAALQQQDLMRRRRGVYGNITGASQQAAPIVSNKSALGT